MTDQPNEGIAPADIVGEAMPAAVETVDGESPNPTPEPDAKHLVQQMTVHLAAVDRLKGKRAKFAAFVDEIDAQIAGHQAQADDLSAQVGADSIDAALASYKQDLRDEAAALTARLAEVDAITGEGA